MGSRLVDNCPDVASAVTNYVYISDSDELNCYKNVEICGFIFTVCEHTMVKQGCITLNSVQRKNLGLVINQNVLVKPYQVAKDLPNIGILYGKITYLTEKSNQKKELQEEKVINQLLETLKGQILTKTQQIAFALDTINYKLFVDQLVYDLDGKSIETNHGIISDNTAFIFDNEGNNLVTITDQKGYASCQIFKTKTINFESLGIGGLDQQFEVIFRRAFASRVFPPSIIQRLGIKHVKGILLYGQPGTGKTLIARQIGKMLNKREPKIVNGPEVLNKFVGQSEENIRNLFAEAEAEYKAKGDASELHIIIFDEIDAICKKRGSINNDTGTNDTVVNQLLTKIDGVNALNNILLIGMTNRKDMLDEALLRPGRLEVQIEISLPDTKGRLEILKIHTSKMKNNAFLSSNVNLDHLSQVTRNFSGAELEGLVKNAAAYALNRNINFDDLSAPLDEKNLQVYMEDFENALKEIKPAFGTSVEKLESYLTYGIIPYGQTFEKLQRTLFMLVEKVRNTDNMALLSVLLEGQNGSGKSALAASVAKSSDFPFCKVISSDAMVGYSEQAKVNHIINVFEDSYKSPLSLIILDDIERLLEYVGIGPRFSNIILQTLIVCIQRIPPKGHKLLVIGTSNLYNVLESMGITFTSSLHVPILGGPEIERVLRQLSCIPDESINSAVDMIPKAMPIKKLLYLVEVSREENEKISLERWEHILHENII